MKARRNVNAMTRERGPEEVFHFSLAPIRIDPGSGLKVEMQFVWAVHVAIQKRDRHKLDL